MTVKDDIIRCMNRFTSSQDELLGIFGVPDTWFKMYPEDCLSDYWFLLGLNRIVASDLPFTEESIKKGDSICVSAIFTYREFSQYVWRKHGLVLVSVDTQTDGNKHLGLFDEDRECKDSRLIELCDRCW
jgi:hypothetical protein